MIDHQRYSFSFTLTFISKLYRKIQFDNYYLVDVQIIKHFHASGLAFLRAYRKHINVSLMVA